MTCPEQDSRITNQAFMRGNWLSFADHATALDDLVQALQEREFRARLHASAYQDQYDPDVEATRALGAASARIF